MKKQFKESLAKIGCYEDLNGIVRDFEGNVVNQTHPLFSKVSKL